MASCLAKETKSVSTAGSNRTCTGMWEAVETKARKIRVAKTKGGRKERRSGKEERRERGKMKGK